MTSGHDFGTLYGRADMTNILYPEGWVHGVIEDAVYGKTKDGTKGQWVLKVRTSEGENAGKMPLSGYITISYDKERALGAMFRRLAAVGVCVPDPKDPTRLVNGQVPFWVNPQTGQPYPPDGTAERVAEQVMKGRPVQVKISHDEWEGVTRSKIDDFREPRPGAPTAWPQDQTQPQQQGYYPGSPSVAAQQQGPYGAQPGQAFPGQVFPGQAGPPQPPQQPPPGQPWQQQNGAPGQPAQPPWQQQGPPQGQPQPAPQAPPGAPPWAAPAVPGQGGTAEFTQQGQSFQPSHMAQPPAQQQPPWQQPAAPPAQPQQFQQPPPMQPPAPFQPPQQPWGQQPQQGQPQPPQGPAEEPPRPPWAQ